MRHASGTLGHAGNMTVCVTSELGFFLLFLVLFVVAAAAVVVVVVVVVCVSPVF